MSPQDQYLQSQLPQILQPGEQVLHTAYMRRQPGLVLQLLLLGGLLLALMTKGYFAILTNRRLILIRTKPSFWMGTPLPMNLGVEDYDVRGIQKVTVSGIANNRSMTFHMADGKKQTLRISPWFKHINGTKAFFEQVPNLVASGQLAQMTGGAAPNQMMGGAPNQMMGGQPGYAPAHQAAPAYAPQHAAPPAYGAPPALGPGARILVNAPDGNRYPATLVQEQNGHYLCAMPNGQQHWFPIANVQPA